MQDKLGHKLLYSRINSIPKIFSDYLKSPLSVSKNRFEQCNFIITGTGSSIAHAHYLCYLLNDLIGLRAEVKPLSYFLQPKLKKTKNACLIVISQGLSNNALLALKKRKQFKDCILFTAATLSGLEKNSKFQSSEMLTSLTDEGVSIVNFPLENEYTILVRVIGPLLGYLACYKFSQVIARRLKTSIASPIAVNSQLSNAYNSYQRYFSKLSLLDFQNGFNLLATNPCIRFLDNICFKMLEGPFWNAPNTFDILHFAHGPFQNLKSNPKPCIILNEYDQVTNLACQMLKKINIEPVIIESILPSELKIFEYEQIFNYFMLDAIRNNKANQLDWPAKGLDSPLYNYS